MKTQLVKNMETKPKSGLIQGLIMKSTSLWKSGRCALLPLFLLRRIGSLAMEPQIAWSLESVDWRNPVCHAKLC